MKRTFHFALNRGHATVLLTSGEDVLLPIIPGILKHLSATQLACLLQDERVARKYTRIALEKMSWPVVRQFPKAWLLANMDHATLTDSRKKALLHLLG